MVQSCTVLCVVLLLCLPVIDSLRRWEAGTAVYQAYTRLAVTVQLLIRVLANIPGERLTLPLTPSGHSPVQMTVALVCSLQLWHSLLQARTRVHNQTCKLRK